MERAMTHGNIVSTGGVVDRMTRGSVRPKRVPVKSTAEPEHAREKISERATDILDKIPPDVALRDTSPQEAPIRDSALPAAEPLVANAEKSRQSVVDCLSSSDFHGARDAILEDIYETVGSSSSASSPQFASNDEILKAIRCDESRDKRLTFSGLELMRDRYFLKDIDGEICETPQIFFARISTGLACAIPDRVENQLAYAQRFYDIISKLWFMPATPILSNVGTSRGLPISCFLNKVDDSVSGIYSALHENAILAKNGGGIGSYVGGLRHANAPLSSGGRSSGVIPFLKIFDSSTLAIHQGGIRRAASAVYMDIDHPDIYEFLEIRKPTGGGDFERKCLNLHHAVVITDRFMEAVEARENFPLVDRRTNEVIREIDAFELFLRILRLRVETGEPFLLFYDNVNKSLPSHHKEHGFTVSQSNLCSEIVLPTSNERTAICCLGSLNLERFDEYDDEETLTDTISLAVRALDNVLDIFIKGAQDPWYKKALESATKERSIGLGVMGYHGMLMKNNIPVESDEAALLNRDIFKRINHHAISASKALGSERGVCADAHGTSFTQRHSYVMAIAPTASISTIAGNATPCVEPIVGNAFTHKTLSGTFVIRNRHLEALLQKKGLDIYETWSAITADNGSVQGLSALSDHEKRVFKTAFEIDQKVLVRQAADRQEWICQSQSMNLFFDPPVSLKGLYDVHLQAWQQGCKSLYYLRSRPLIRADVGTHASTRTKHIDDQFTATAQASDDFEYDECTSCQ